MLVYDVYHVGQLVEGEVSRVTSFGAFVSLEPGIEALLHNSQMYSESDKETDVMLYEGQRLLMRIISIESHRQRLGLSLKEVNKDERQAWEETLLSSAEAEAQLEAEAQPEAQPETETQSEASLEEDAAEFSETEADAGMELADEVQSTNLVE